MKRTLLYTLAVVVVASAGLVSYIKISSGKVAGEMNFTEAKSGSFEIVVSGTGELTPERSLEIKGPNTVQRNWFRAAPLKLTDIVPEGTIVKKGDYIGSLDRSSFENTLKDEVTKLNEIKANYDMKLLDTAVVLNTLRDDIRNQAFIAEEAALVVEQSTYEPPATQRQAELELDKAGRFLEQKKRLYNLKRAQSSLEIRNLSTELRMQLNLVKNYEETLAAFTIKSPADGMITYARDRTGVKIKSGSTIHPFNPIIATLPDLASLNSKIYISEIEINKVRRDQPVEVAIDAFPGKSFTGKVVSIANIGEQIQNSDSKVFEVLIKLDGSDPMLRPSMTTSNTIIINDYDKVVYIAQESVHAGPDSLPFVYTKDGFKQFVLLGKSNDKNIIVEDGLKEGTPVYLTTPENSEKFSLAGTDLIPVIRERNNAGRIESDKVMGETEIIAVTGSGHGNVKQAVTAVE
jgi:HlyD family secretion protein